MPDREALKQASGITHPAPPSTADWIAEIRCADSPHRLRGQPPLSLVGLVELTGPLPRHREDLAQLPVLAGTDVGPQMEAQLPGLSLHNVLVTFVLGGMNPLAALQAATINPARALHATDSLGTVQVGELADLVLLDADPLADIWNTTKIRAIVANGRYFDQPALERLRAQAERAAAPLNGGRRA